MRQQLMDILICPMCRGELELKIEKEADGEIQTGTITRLPNLNMRAATGSTVTGWLASQTDILAEDWVDLDADAPPPSKSEACESCR